jgi:hypothetical protein
VASDRSERRVTGAASAAHAPRRVPLLVAAALFLALLFAPALLTMGLYAEEPPAVVDRELAEAGRTVEQEVAALVARP